MGRDAACDDSRSDGEALAGYWAGPGRKRSGASLSGPTAAAASANPCLLPCRCSLSAVGRARVKRLVLCLYSAPSIFKVFFFVYFPSQITQQQPVKDLNIA
jgi:hypothetical protein